MGQSLDPKRHLIFTAAFFVIFATSSSNVFSIFAGQFQESTGGTASQVALTLTVYQTAMALCGILSGKIVDARGPKVLTYVGGIIYGIGWASAAFATSIPMLYITFGVLAGAGNGLLYNPALNTAMRWYPEKKGTMSGILLTAAVVGPMVTAKVGAILLETVGLNGFIILGASYIALICLVGWKMISPPAEWKPAGYVPPATAGGLSKVNFTAKEMVSTSRFWILLVLFALSTTSGIMLIGSLSRIAQVQLEMTAIVAANMVILNLISNFIGRLILGKLCDKIGDLKTLGIILVASVIGLAGLYVATTTIVFSIFLAILSAAFGGVLVIFPPLTNRMFGMKYSGSNYGFMFLAYPIGAFIGPQISAIFVNPDLGTRAYSQAYLVAIGVATVAFLINFYLIKTDKKSLDSQAVEVKGA